MSFTTPDAVQNIVLSRIGGQTLTPATTTIIEGKVVTPQIGTICSLGPSLGDAFADIEDALRDFLDGVNKFVINPIKEIGLECKAAIQSALTAIADALALADATLTAALNIMIGALNDALASVDAALAHAGELLEEKFHEIVAACSFCSPPQVPSAKKYGKEDIAGTLDQGSNISVMSSYASQVGFILSDGTLSNAEKATQLNQLSTSLGNGTLTLTNRVNDDKSNLTAAQNQNNGLSKLTQMASGLNNPDTAPFINQIMDPTHAGAINKIATAMKNPVV